MRNGGYTGTPKDFDRVYIHCWIELEESYLPYKGRVRVSFSLASKLKNTVYCGLAAAAAAGRRHFRRPPQAFSASAATAPWSPLSQRLNRGALAANCSR